MSSEEAEVKKEVYRCDVAIVGGGIAGLYAAYRLRQVWLSADQTAREKLADKLNLKLDEILRVVILEENPLELGGRVRAVKLPFPKGAVTAEVGPMRFTTRQILLRRLLHDLDIKTIPFKGEGFEKSYFLRGKHFSDDDVKAGRAPYELQNTPDRPERNKTVDELVQTVFDTTLTGLSIDSDSYFDDDRNRSVFEKSHYDDPDHKTPLALTYILKTERDPQVLTNAQRKLDEDYLSTLRALEKLRDKTLRSGLTHGEWRQIQEHCLLLGKIHLRDIGLWNLLHHYLSPDAAKLVEDGFGYESVIGNWNLSDAIPWFIDDFGLGQSYEAVEQGFSYLIECLKKQLAPDKQPNDECAEKRFTCQVFFNTRVRKVAISKDEPDRYEIKATKTALRYKHINDADAFELGKDDNMHWREWNAGSIILAIPKEPLSKLNVSDLLGDPGPDGTAEQKKKWKPVERVWRAKLDAVRAHRLAKLVHAYRAPWWRTPEASKGSGSLIITDLPLRQLYYWDQEWLDKRGRYEFYEKGKRIPGDPGRPPGIGGIVVAYLDGHYVSYWRFITAVQRRNEAVADFREDENGSIPEAEKAEQGKRSRFGRRVWGWGDPQEVSPVKWSDGEEDKQDYPRMDKLYKKPVEGWSDEERTRYLYLRKHGLFERASTKMTHILKDLHASMKNGKQVSVEDPVVGAYTFWDDFGDDPIPETGWHTWEPGVNSEEAMNYMAQPFKKDDTTWFRVYVCGEAFSNEQGWIEGALKSVERVIQKLGVKLPSDVCEHAGVCRKECKHDLDSAKAEEQI